MKVGEITTSVIIPDFLLLSDPDFAAKFPHFDRAKPIKFQLTLLKLLKVVDLYRDQTVMYHPRERGSGSASPYSDCVVTIRVRIAIGNKTVYSNFAGESEESEAVYDLENYEAPALVRKIIKKMKKAEILRVHIKNSTKVNDHLEDPHRIFRSEWLESPEIMLDIQLVDWF